LGKEALEAHEHVVSSESGRLIVVARFQPATIQYHTEGARASVPLMEAKHRMDKGGLCSRGPEGKGESWATGQHQIDDPLRKIKPPIGSAVANDNLGGIEPVLGAVFQTFQAALTD
jgi:hypothetical protein